MNGTSELQIVVCQLGNERYGLDIAGVYEIIRRQPITAVPGAPAGVEGIINLRGRIIPVVDLRTRFGMERGEPTRATRIVVAETNGTRVGLVVDAVSEVLSVQAEAIESADSVVTGADLAAVRGIAKLQDRLVILLTLDGLLLLGDAEEVLAATSGSHAAPGADAGHAAVADATADDHRKVA